MMSGVTVRPEGNFLPIAANRPLPEKKGAFSRLDQIGTKLEEAKTALQDLRRIGHLAQTDAAGAGQRLDIIAKDLREIKKDLTEYARELESLGSSLTPELSEELRGVRELLATIADLEQTIIQLKADLAGADHPAGTAPPPTSEGTQLRAALFLLSWGSPDVIDVFNREMERAEEENQEKAERASWERKKKEDEIAKIRQKHNTKESEITWQEINLAAQKGILQTAAADNTLAADNRNGALALLANIESALHQAKTAANNLEARADRLEKQLASAGA